MVNTPTHSDTDESVGPQRSELSNSVSDSSVTTVIADAVNTPWYPNGVSHQNVRLNAEIEVFTKHILLREGEHRARNLIRSSVQGVIASIWQGATVKAYGSFANGLSLPCSSLDLVCEGADINEQNLRILNQTFQERGYAVLGSMYNDEMGYISVQSSGIAVNLSMVKGKSMARQSVSLIKKWLEEFPVAKQVVVIIRSILSQAKYLDPSTGGISSYAILAMLIHVCRCTPQPHSADQVLFSFLLTYGKNFDFANYAIHPEHVQPLQRSSPSDNSIIVMDPLDPANNLTISCTRLAQIRVQFSYCLMALGKWDANAGTRRGYKVCAKKKKFFF